MPRQFILASGSQRRQELLSQMGVPFELYVPEVDERLNGSAEQVVVELARRKALEAARVYPKAAVLAADTLVTIEGEVLGKPQDLFDAARMLRRLSGAWHEVHTGVCLVVDSAAEFAHVKTDVLFSNMTEDEIRLYCDSGEPLGKAGAYAIQGLGGMFIQQIHGNYTNVVGLPTSVVYQMLKKANIL
ncbi:MAG: septum formation protein Maf [Clostridiales bacterium]|nr:septum formation protein Maf [Clostridiales bacterium]